MIHVTCYIRRLAAWALALFALIVIFSPLFTASPAFAQDYTPLAPIKADGTLIEFTGCNPNLYTPDPTDPKKEKVIETPIGELCLPKYLTTIYSMGIALAGLFLVFAIVRGGFTLMFTDSVLGKLEGKKIILQAMGGAVIVFSSYLLMNTINPQLAQDLNLSLKFPRVKIEKFESYLIPVDIEFEKLEKAIDERRGKIATERAGIKEKLSAFKTQLEEALRTNDTEEIARLRGEIVVLEQKDAQLALTDHAELLEKKTTFQGERAQSRGAADSLYNNYFRPSGNRITEMRSAYDEYRVAVKDNVAAVISSHGAQMGRIGSSAEAVATALLANPTNATRGIAFTAEHTRELADAQTKIGAAVSTIDYERRQRVAALTTLHATAPDVQTQRLIRQTIGQVNGLARANLAHIKDKCVQAEYSCKDNPILGGL